MQLHRTPALRLALLGLFAAFAVLLIACGGDDGDDGGATDGNTVASPASGATDVPAGDTASDPTETPEADAPGGADAPAGGGEAVLTVGDQSWSFTGVYCAFGPEETQNSRVSFSSGAFGEIDGTRVQLDASIQDPQEDGRYEGDGVIQTVTLDDIQDFENPSIGWASVSGFVGPSTLSFQIDGKNVTVQGPFDDQLTDAIEEVDGTLELTCP